MNDLELIKNSSTFLKIKNAFNNGCLNHSILLISKDEFLRNLYIEAISELILKDNIKVKAHSHPDFVEYPSVDSENILVSDVENILEKSVMVPSEADYKVFVLHSNSNFSQVCQNKLLKILEEPPKNLFFVVEASSTNEFLPTFLSRCHKIVLKNFTKEDFKILGYDELTFFKSNGKISIANKLTNDEQFLKTYNSCLLALNKLESSSDIVYVSRCVLDKKHLKTIINVFELIFDLLLNNEKCVGEFSLLKNNFTTKAIVNIIPEINRARNKLKANCLNHAILDCLLLKIVEEKHYGKK